MYGWTLHKYIHFHMDESSNRYKAYNICRRKRVLEIIFLHPPFWVWFQLKVHPVGYGWKPSVQGKCSAAATRRLSTSAFVFFRVFFVLAFRAFVAMIPHSISHPFLDLKSLTIPHLCEVQKLKTYIKKKQHLCGVFYRVQLLFSFFFL